MILDVNRKINEVRWEPMLARPAYEVYMDRAHADELLPEIQAIAVKKVHRSNFGKFGEKFVCGTKSRTVLCKPTACALKERGNQNQVMGNTSANQMAAALGLPRKEQFKHLHSHHAYEWLHLSANSYGAPLKEAGEGKEMTPNLVRNLILGTGSANTQMIIDEDIAKKLLGKEGVTAIVEVTVDMHAIDESTGTYASWIAEALLYKVLLKYQNTPFYAARYQIDPFMANAPTRSQKSVAEALMQSCFDKKLQPEEISLAIKRMAGQASPLRKNDAKRLWTPSENSLEEDSLDAHPASVAPMMLALGNPMGNGLGR